MSRLLENYLSKNKEKEELYNNAKECYKNGESLTSICERLPFERKQLSRLFKSEGLQIRTSKYKYNTNSFKNIKTELDAYWLGYMYADGHVSEYRFTCDLSMSEKDRYHLEKFRDYIGTDCPIVERSCKIKGYEKTHKSVRLYITNKAISENLISHGCIGYKTFDIKIPELKSNLLRHFIRGFFDGDGYICISTQDHIGFVSGSKEFLIELKNILIAEIGIADNKIIKDNRRESCYRVQWSGNNDINNFHDYLYKRSKIYLDRKHLKITQILGRFNSKSLKS